MPPSIHRLYFDDVDKGGPLVVTARVPPLVVARRLHLSCYKNFGPLIVIGGGAAYLYKNGGPRSCHRKGTLHTYRLHVLLSLSLSHTIHKKNHIMIYKYKSVSQGLCLRIHQPS